MATSSRVQKSTELYDRAGELIPGWTQLISRRATGHAQGVSPVYATSAKGARFTDVDGNEYLDWVVCFTAVVLGYADEVVDGAVKEQIDRGSLYSVNSPLEIEFAEELVDAIPSAEMVRYTKGGGDSCALAVRIARGGTGRDKILFSGYHGWHDWYQAANLLSEEARGGATVTGTKPIGVPRALEGTAIPFAEGDLERLKRLFEENKGEVAAVMMEPMRTELPPEGYLEAVKELCQANDAILIFDEVSCGWRPAVGGVQEYLGVTPDMSVFAKAISNGYPMGAVVGSREVMEPAAEMFVSSSYWSDNVGLAAGLATVRELKRRNSAERFEELGKRLKAALSEAMESVGIAGRVAGHWTNPTIELDLPDKSLAPKVSTLFIQEMAKRGIYTPLSFHATLAHTEEDIRITADAVEETLRVIMKGLEGDLDNLLEAKIKKDLIARLVR
jgi:glutamate-1-semialdehyde aminotransferase